MLMSYPDLSLRISTKFKSYVFKDFIVIFLKIRLKVVIYDTFRSQLTMIEISVTAPSSILAWRSAVIANTTSYQGKHNKRT